MVLLLPSVVIFSFGPGYTSGLVAWCPVPLWQFQPWAGSSTQCPAGCPIPRDTLIFPQPNNPGVTPGSATSFQNDSLAFALVCIRIGHFHCQAGWWYFSISALPPLLIYSLPITENLPGPGHFSFPPCSLVLLPPRQSSHLLWIPLSLMVCFY